MLPKFTENWNCKKFGLSLKENAAFLGSCGQSIWNKSSNLSNSYFLTCLSFLQPLQNHLFWDSNGRRAWVPCSSKAAVKLPQNTLTNDCEDMFSSHDLSYYFCIQ